MSWFMASIYDRFMRDMEAECGHAWRRALLADLRGEVLEIGAGTGRNLEHYGPLDRLVLAEPDAHMRAKLTPRVAASWPRAECVAWSAERIAAPDASFDAVVSTLVLCSVESPSAVLAEIRRVLRPTGRLIFMEHVASTDPGRLGWQRRVEPLWRPLAGNCHLCRDTERTIAAAGFAFESLVRESARKALPIVRPTIRGVACPV